jgi:hypothetical protein
MKLFLPAFLLLLIGRVGSDIFVSPAGDDANPGTRDRPVATLHRARDLAREIAGEKTIWIGPGTYSLEKPLELTDADGSTCWRGERARLLGGRIVQGFKPVADPQILARLPEAARDAVRVLDLKAAGITDLGRFRSRGFGRPMSPAHLEVFVDHHPMTPARWPNEGQWQRIAGVAEPIKDEWGGAVGKLEGGFLIGTDHPKDWKSLDDVWMHGYWDWDWANSYEKLASIDWEKKHVKTTEPFGLYGFRKGQRFYFLNVLEELDQPGEYYVDRVSGMLYLWPPEQGKETLVSVVEAPLISITNASRITIRGITIEATRGSAIAVSGGENCTIAGCLLMNVGTCAVTIEGGKGHRVVACDISNCGDGGVLARGGDRQTLAAGGHAVENCRFARQGRWSRCYVPSIRLGGVGNRAAHNVISEHPHCAILLEGNDHVVEFNEIHHVAQETGDVGAIYIGRDYTYRGNVIRHNFLHDIRGVGMGSMGAYMDDCVSGTEIVGNVFYRVRRAVLLGGGRDHRVENNLFVYCRPAIHADARGSSKSPVWREMVYGYMKKQLDSVPGELYRARYPAIKALDRYYEGKEGIPPEGNVIARNVCQGKWIEFYDGAKAEMMEIKDNYVAGDVGIESVDEMNFRLKADSPAWKPGFIALPLEQMGLAQDEWRRDGKVEAER